MQVETEIAAPRPPQVFPANNIFVSASQLETDQFLKPLMGMHLRASLFAIRVEGLSPAQTLLLIEYAFLHIGLPGTISNGDKGLLYVGPRPAGPAGDREVQQWVVALTRWTLQYIADARQTAAVDVLGAHAWFDEAESAEELMLDLVSALEPPSPSHSRMGGEILLGT